MTSIDPFAYQIIPDLGLMYLAGSLREAGLEVDIKDCRKEGWDFDRLGEYVGRSRPLIVGVKSYTNEAGRVSQMAKVIRQVHPGAVIIVGGPHPSMVPALALSSMPEIDYAFLGEAEISLRDFAIWVKDGGGGAPPDTINGIAFRGDSGVLVRESLFEDDLDKLPMPAWDLMRPDHYPDEAAGIFVPAFPAAPIMFTRGCPFRCTYCGGRRVMGGRLRHRSVESVLSEIDFLEREYGVRTFTFVDDCFTQNRSRAMAMFEALAQRERRIAFTFPNGIRTDSLDREMLELMERAGCYVLALGIESGSDETLSRMKKGQTVAMIREKVELIRSCSSIQITGFFIMGYPGESISDVKDTIRLAVNLPIHHAHFCLFIPIPGTPIYQELEEKGVVCYDQYDPEDFTIDSAKISLPGLLPDKLLRLHQYAYLRFYLKPWRIISLLGQLKSREHLWVILRRVIKIFR